MRTTIDAPGRILVPRALRDILGFETGADLDIAAVHGRGEVHGLRMRAPVGTPPLTVALRPGGS
jgi:bifunctional DNA-binding transcriptional regulator/antitoxin component of YhaV-PrlF toxin-antitoxin module